MDSRGHIVNNHSANDILQTTAKQIPRFVPSRDQHPVMKPLGTATAAMFGFLYASSSGRAFAVAEQDDISDGGGDRSQSNQLFLPHSLDNDVIAVMFSWNFTSVAEACVSDLGPKGYAYVQISPPQEHVLGSQWWTSYQPVSYSIAGRLGTANELQHMIATCRESGVGVIVDAVINHMSGKAEGVGTNGTTFTKYNYSGLYRDNDFHSCREPIADKDYRTSRLRVQECELLGLSDLNTGRQHVQQQIATYMNTLIDMGVKGFRIDAAKHINPKDLVAIRRKLKDPFTLFILEVVSSDADIVTGRDYLDVIASIHEFLYSRSLKRLFDSQNISTFRTLVSSKFLPSEKAGVFVTNHDTERSGDALTYKDHASYILAHVLMLATPYGLPSVHSGYDFTAKDAGPPTKGDNHVEECHPGTGWVCQHRWPQIANMVGFRKAVTGREIVDWWDNGRGRVAFGRGSKGFIAVNSETDGGNWTWTFRTSLPRGLYYDVQHPDQAERSGFRSIYINEDGSFVSTISAGEAVAVYCEKSLQAVKVPSANIQLRTNFSRDGRDDQIFISGNISQLGGWDLSKAVPLSPAQMPLWRVDLLLPPGISFEYKFVKRSRGGVWEAEAAIPGDRQVTLPSDGGRVSVQDEWREFIGKI